MPELSVKEKIKNLVDVQKVDSEIYKLNIELKEKPELVAELKSQFESTKAKLNELEEKDKSIQLKRKDIELELKTKEDSILKANAQLSDIKTNKEYSAKINEIESIKADKSQFEEKILLSYDESDSVKADIEEEKQKVAGEEKIYLEKKKEVEADIKEIRDRIKVLEGKRNQIVPAIDEVLLTRYEKVLKHKEGLAIAAVIGNSCGGCYMNVTQQELNALKMSDNIITCEHCSRIMYIEEDS